MVPQYNKSVVVALVMSLWSWVFSAALHSWSCRPQLWSVLLPSHFHPLTYGRSPDTVVPNPAMFLALCWRNFRRNGDEFSWKSSFYSDENVDVYLYTVFIYVAVVWEIKVNTLSFPWPAVAAKAPEAIKKNSHLLRMCLIQSAIHSHSDGELIQVAVLSDLVDHSS